jgi:hypothetical protein
MLQTPLPATSLREAMYFAVSHPAATNHLSYQCKTLMRICLHEKAQALQEPRGHFEKPQNMKGIKHRLRTLFTYWELCKHINNTGSLYNDLCDCNVDDEKLFGRQ